MKGFLIFVVFSCCAWGGVSLCLTLRQRSLLLQKMVGILLQLENRMTQQKQTLREALEQLADMSESGPGHILAERMLEVWQMPGSMADNWEACAQRLCREEREFRLLTEQERLWLARLIREQADFSTQLDGKETVWLMRWKDSAETADTLYKTKGVLWGKMGLMVGLALAILML